MSTIIKQPSTMSGMTDSEESTTALFLYKAPLFGTTATSSHFQYAGTLCRSSIMPWDMGLEGQPSIMAGEWAGMVRGLMRWQNEHRARTDQVFSPALIPRMIPTIGH